MIQSFVPLKQPMKKKIDTFGLYFLKIQKQFFLKAGQTIIEER